MKSKDQVDKQQPWQESTIRMLFEQELVSPFYK